jgi:hypothetical protein
MREQFQTQLLKTQSELGSYHICRKGDRSQDGDVENTEIRTLMGGPTGAIGTSKFNTK